MRFPTSQTNMGFVRAARLGPLKTWSANSCPTSACCVLGTSLRLNIIPMAFGCHRFMNGHVQSVQRWFPVISCHAVPSDDNLLGSWQLSDAPCGSNCTTVVTGPLT